MPSSLRRFAAASVPSPPMAISDVMPCSSMTWAMRSGPPPFSNGFVREVPRIVPPCFEMPMTWARPRGMVSPSTTPFQPLRKPTNSRPYRFVPVKTAERITALRPGQSPPLVRMPILIASIMPCPAGGQKPHASSTRGRTPGLARVWTSRAAAPAFPT